MSTNTLANKRIVVIGGTSGIGLATARALLDSGASVVVAGRSRVRAADAAERLAAAGRTPDRITPAEVEIGDDASVTRFAAEIGGLDHVFIAAGSTKLGGVLGDDQLSDLLGAFDTRVRGSVRLVRALAPGVRSGGSFVFTGGLSTDRPIKGAWVSGLGTATAEQLARVLALELAPIRFNAISPGWTDTPMWDAVLGENKQAVFREVASKWPIPRLVTADEVASAVVFLMSNAAITGEILHVDGGQRLA